MTYLIYKERLSLKRIEVLSTIIPKHYPRAGVIWIGIIIDIYRNQGSTPADIGGRVMDDRDSSTVKDILDKLHNIGWLDIENVPQREKNSPRKRVYLSKTLAELLWLDPGRTRQIEYQTTKKA